MAYKTLRQELEDAAFRPELRADLHTSLRSDVEKLAKVRAELAQIEQGAQFGLLDRDAISKHIYEMLKDMLRRLDDEPAPAVAPARIVQA
jgi:hypothetical protein